MMNQEMNANSSAPSSGNMSAGSSMTSPLVLETERKRVNLAHLVFDVDGHSITTQNRLHSTSHFILQHDFDDLLYPESLLMEGYVDFYLGVGEDGRRIFLGAKLMASNMIDLEDSIIRLHPDRDYDDLSDEALNAIIREHLIKKEMDMLQKDDPIFSKGIGLSVNMIQQVLESKSYAEELENSVNNDSHSCCICMENYKRHQGIATLKYCGHKFHQTCIMTWLNDHRLCPLCKKMALPAIAEYPDWVKDLGMVRDFLKRVY